MIKSFRKAKKNLALNSIVTFVSIVIGTLTFFLLSLFLYFAYLSNHVLQTLESRAQITVYFQDSADEDYILSLKKDLLNMKEVKEVNYTSKDTALKIFKEMYQSEPLLTENIDSEILPASLDVNANDIADLDKISSYLKGKDKIEEISYFKDELTKFKSFSNGIKYIGVALILLMLFITFLIDLVLVGVTIRERSEEIKISRLLGATDIYIEGPFFAQGSIVAFLSSLFSIVLFIAVLPFIEPFVFEKFSGIPIPSLTIISAVIIFMLSYFVNLLLSFFGTFVALKKYMNV